jgi:taurine dioxygenase
MKSEAETWSSATGTVELERVTGTIGAKVRGLDLHDLHGADLDFMLRRALAQHGVLFFDLEGPIGDEELKDFASHFGDIEPFHYGRTNRGREVALLDMQDGASAVLARTNVWHTDSSALTSPPAAALLTPKRITKTGGDTMWASMTAAYDALSSHLQRLLEGMDAHHSNTSLTRHYSDAKKQSTFGSGSPDRAVHPVVPTEPLTGRKYLYVNANYTHRMIGLKDSESDRLLAMLYDHINTPEFHVRLRWQPGTIAVWHERLTQHRVVADWTGRRMLRQVLIKGEPPVR